MLQEMRKWKQIEGEGIATPNAATDIGSNSANSRAHPPPPTRNLVDVFIGMPPSRPTNPPVVLVDRTNKELARGFVVIYARSNIFHGRVLGRREKKVYIKKVYDRDVPLWDRAQDGHTTLGSYVDGGFIIWLDACLNYV